MPRNSFGSVFSFTSFGESHGPATGGVVDGCPAGLEIDFDFIQNELSRRNLVYPGTTGRKEADDIIWLSGLMGNKTLGTPIAFMVRNLDAKPGDYNELTGFYRPSHADYAYDKKYGISDQSGGGRASGRETVARVVAGSIAKILLKDYGIDIKAVITQVGSLKLGEHFDTACFDKAQQNNLRLADPGKEDSVMALLQQMVDSGDTIGGSVSCRIKGCPAGLGEPVFKKLQSELAAVMMSIGTAKGFEYGLGFGSMDLHGSTYNDQMSVEDGEIYYLSNHDGGIQGGISNGQDIYFRVAFKPVPSVRLPQKLVNSKGETREVLIQGRHDTCHVPRLVVVVESMAALVMADHLLLNKTARIH